MLYVKAIGLGIGFAIEADLMMRFTSWQPETIGAMLLGTGAVLCAAVLIKRRDWPSDWLSR